MHHYIEHNVQFGISLECFTHEKNYVTMLENTSYANVVSRAVKYITQTMLNTKHFDKFSSSEW